MNAQNDKTLDELLRKIRALKAKAEDSSVTEAEAAIFMAKVAELLARHGLEEASLRVEEQAPITSERETISEWSSSPARRQLAAAVCRLYMVRPVTSGPGKKEWTLVGRKANLIIVRDMMSYLVRTTLRMSNQYAKETGGDRIDFRRGCFTRLADRVNDLYHQQKRQAAPAWTPSGNPNNLPALYETEKSLIDSELQKLFPKLRWHKAKPVRIGRDGLMGQRAGDGISLSPQVGGGRGNLMIGRK
jgi:hypothetical protein